MITADYYIDQIQTSKKAMIKFMVVNETLARSMNDFVDHQTEYTKNFVSAANKVASELTTEIIKSGQEAMKFDYVKFMESLGSSLSAQKSKKS